MRLRIGNQTAISAACADQPFAFALEHGFDAFEWFPDRNESGAGWTEDDLDPGQRAAINEAARNHDLRLSVHAPWWANPLNPDAFRILDKCLEFAQNLGASLLNLHLYPEQGAEAFVRAIAPLIERLASTQIRLAVENTPLTGPAECNALFEALTRWGLADGKRLGLCFDMGHANLCQATHNDYLRFLDLLALDVPVIHLHLHENYGDRDSHLPLFTGPAGHDPSGLEGLLQRLAKRNYAGCAILEQWPEPPTLLCDARERLLEMLGKLPPDDGETVTKVQGLPKGGRFSRPQNTLSRPEEFSEVLVEADRRNRSWREKLSWIRDMLNSPEIASDLEKLAGVAIYLRFIGTGQIACQEDGRHFRPSHHAVMAREMTERLAGITTSQNVSIVRSILPWLPSSACQFTRSEPLTLIRDIAHRNDIPHELKTEIKHTLQNKLHRCAGPEDLVTSAAILARLTASEGAYPAAFVAQFQHFHEQLEEFFNARSLEEQLAAMAGEPHEPGAGLIRSFLEAKAEVADLPQRHHLLQLLSELREQFRERLADQEGSVRQRLLRVDLRLEEFAFALLSQVINAFEAEAPALAWSMVLDCLRLTVENLRCSGFDRLECRAVEAELAAWREDFEPDDAEQRLRLKATLERARRLADDYRDTILRLIPPCAAGIGKALDVPDAAVAVYAESEIRSHVVFQLAKMLMFALKALRGLAGWSPWEVIVPGDAIGRLAASPALEQLPRSEEPTIVLIDRLQGDEELPSNVSGVIACHETPYLSHFAVRAREHGVVFVACDEAGPISAARSWAGRWVTLQASSEKVAVRTAAEGPSLAASQQPDIAPRSLGAAAIELCREPWVLSLDRVTVANSGRKAYGARLIEALSAQEGAHFLTPRSVVIPFGLMEAALRSQRSVAGDFHRCVDILHQLPPEGWSESLEQLRRLTGCLEVPEAIVAQVMAQFGPDARLMVRSSASCEDMEEIAGAGLYESVANVAANGLADAVREVWASLWSRQATASRRRAGFPGDRAFMGVLIQEVVIPDLSFIIYTSNPITGSADELLVELVVGLGQTLASADHPGNPYRLIANKLTGEVRWLAFANFSKAILPRRRGGTLAKILDYSKVAFSRSASLRQSLARRLTGVGRFVEEALNAPQDIEGVVAGEFLYLVQSRPQQGVGGK